MSKKTRKKTPKPAPRKAARARTVKSAKSRPSQTPGATAGKSGKKQSRNARSGESHKAPTKRLKPPAAALLRAKAAAATRPGKPVASKTKPPGGKSTAPANRTSVLGEGTMAPDFQLPRDGGSTVSLSDYAGKKLVLFFYPRADTPAAPRRPSTSRDWRADLPQAGRRYWVFRPTRQERKKPFGTSINCPIRCFQMRPMGCWRPMASGAKNPCMAGPSRAFFAPPC
jgi:hypothetical protein